MQIAMSYGALERLMRMYTNRTEVVEARTKALHAISALVILSSFFCPDLSYLFRHRIRLIEMCRSKAT
jgi:hypothetical protein